MAIAIFQGLPGAGKSYKLGQTVVDILYENKKRFETSQKRFEAGEVKLPPVRRLLHSNLKMSVSIETEFSGFIVYWKDLREISTLRDCDLVIDEVGTYFDARLWETLSVEIRRFLSQHRKFGIRIFGTCQDFAQVDKAFRRLTSHLFHLTKLAGSRDISPTLPPPKYVWGIVMVRELDPTKYDEQISKFSNDGFPGFMFITKSGTDVFDTQAEVAMSSALPLKHIDKVCELPDCKFHKTIHV